MRIPLGAFLWVACALLCGCNISKPDAPPPTVNAREIIVVTATPLPAAQYAATIPPPAPDVSQLFAQADRLARYGYLEEAADSYLRIINDTANMTLTQRGDALFRYGQTTLRAGFFTQAADAFSHYILENPNGGALAHAHFLRGDARLGLSQWQNAISDFQQYLSLRPGVIDSYAYERIADAFVAQARMSEALAQYALAVKAQRSLVPLLALREKVAQINLSVGQPQAAIAQYDAILAVAQNPPYRADIALRAANAQLISDLTGGAARLQAVAENYADTATAWQAITRLSELGYGMDDLRRGKAAYAAGDWSAAVAAFESYLAAGGAATAELLLQLGRAHRNLGDAASAASNFQRIIDDFEDDPLFGAALLERGRTQFLAGDNAAAIALYLAIADDYPQLADAAGEALWRVGYLYGTGGETTLSRQAFTRLADSYPQHDLTLSGLFMAASAAVREEDWAIADELYRRIAELADREDLAAAQLWLGRIALRRNDDSAADEAFANAIAAAPDSYFAARAGDIRMDRQPFQPPESLRFGFDEAADLAEADQWLRDGFGVEQTGDLWRMTAVLQSDVRWVRGMELQAVGAHAESLGEFHALVNAARDAGAVVDSYRLAVALRDLDAHRQSQIAAANVINASGRSTMQAPAALARLRFPAAYIDLIAPEAAQYGFDPLLMLSLIRQESLFNTYATAGAGEKGLTQVIPGTAQYIAEQLDWPDYQHSDLFRPYAGIAFGSFYLDEQLERFDRSAMAALAAYNAGPGRAYDWQALSGGDPDLFMTAITIDTTRMYIRKIYRNHNIYRALYGM